MLSAFWRRLLGVPTPIRSLHEEVMPTAGLDPAPPRVTTPPAQESGAPGASSRARTPRKTARHQQYAELAPVPGMTLVEARAWLSQQLTEGARCPCCTQVAREYRRRLNSGMAYALCVLYRSNRGVGWVHKPTVLRGVGAAARDESLLRHWGLLEESVEQRPDGGRAGWWRVTELGAAFVRGETRVREYVVMFGNRPLRLEGGYIDIERALGSRFNYRELIGVAL